MQTRLLERFLRYVAVTSQSDASQAVVPSTEGQRSLAELLKKDLDELGLVNILFLQVNFRLIYQPEAVNKFRRLVLLLI